jgi:hypothetical protein
MAEVIVDSGWIQYLREKIDQFFDERLGPDVAGTATVLCPKRTGDLAKSIEYSVSDTVLTISATGSDERWYAYWVETGHRLVAWGRQTDEFVAPRPFLRPALYQFRSF